MNTALFIGLALTFAWRSGAGDRLWFQAHCPLSNTFFAGAGFPLRRLLEKSVKVGFGADISGGLLAFLLDSARAAVCTSRALESGVDAALNAAACGVPGARLDFCDALWCAVVGIVEVLDLPVAVWVSHRG